MVVTYICVICVDLNVLLMDDMLFIVMVFIQAGFFNHVMFCFYYHIFTSIIYVVWPLSMLFASLTTLCIDVLGPEYIGYVCEKIRQICVYWCASWNVTLLPSQLDASLHLLMSTMLTMFFTNYANSCFVSSARITVCPSSRTSVVKDAWSYSKNFHNNPIAKPGAKCIYQTITDMVYTLIARRGILVQ